MNLRSRFFALFPVAVFAIQQQQKIKDRDSEATVIIIREVSWLDMVFFLERIKILVWESEGVDVAWSREYESEKWKVFAIDDALESSITLLVVVITDAILGVVDVKVVVLILIVVLEIIEHIYRDTQRYHILSYISPTSYFFVIEKRAYLLLCNVHKEH